MVPTVIAAEPDQVHWKGFLTEQIYVRICLLQVDRGKDVLRYVGDLRDAVRWLNDTWPMLAPESRTSALIALQPALDLTSGIAVARVGNTILIEAAHGLPGKLLIDGVINGRQLLDMRDHMSLDSLAEIAPDLAASGLLDSLRPSGEMYEVGYSPSGPVVLDHSRLPLSAGYEALRDGRLPTHIGPRLSSSSRSFYLERACLDVGLLGEYSGARLLCDGGPRLGHLCTYAETYGYSVEFRDRAATR